MDERLTNAEPTNAGPGTEWLVEAGIGEERAVRLSCGAIAAARLRWPGGLETGLVADAKLIHRRAGASRGTARFADGQEALVSRLPRDAAEGAAIRLAITRPAMAERGRHKRAQAVPTAAAPRPAPTLAERLAEQAARGGPAMRAVPRLPDCDWDALVAEALDGRIAFAGGELDFSQTPAMLLVDVDGTLPPERLALAAAGPVAAAVDRFDCGGSIGIDFPTLADKAARRRVDDALAAALGDRPHERTAMNGFGFVQIVGRLDRPSLLHRAAFDPLGLAARALLRRAERLNGAGVLVLDMHPALERAIRPEWLEMLARRTGCTVRVAPDPALAALAPHAQLAKR